MTPIILSGGSGSRLWPLSRKLYPKQFLALTGEQTLFQQTLQRLSIEGMQPPVLVSNQEHRFIVQEQLALATSWLGLGSGEDVPADVALAPGTELPKPEGCWA